VRAYPSHSKIRVAIPTVAPWCERMALVIRRCYSLKRLWQRRRRLFSIASREQICGLTAD
jgi:hypothetical protein